MSKYNVGDKFIIEIIKDDTTELDTTEYYITNVGRVLKKRELDKLQKYEEEQIPYSEAYNKGLEDAWELADKINNMPMQEVIDVYGFITDRCSVFEKITPQEALAKLEAYEKEQADIKVEVGDVVKLQGEMATEFVVTNIFNSRNYISYNGIASGGKFVADAINVEKTGKHIDIQSVLEQIKE